MSSAVAVSLSPTRPRRTVALFSHPVHVTSQDFAVDALEALEAAVTFAPTPLAAVKEARAWREVIAPTQQQVCVKS